MTRKKLLPLFSSLIATICMASCGVNAPAEQQNPSAPIPAIAEKSVVQNMNQPLETGFITLQVDTERSRGKVALMLDPKGPLGAKPAQSSCALTGKITLNVTNSESGSQHVTLVDVNLSNKTAMDMRFHWPLVGAITVHIPAGSLRITRHTFPASVILANQTVAFPKCHFRVGGDANVLGSGLILSKIVGKRTVDLTIKKTDTVLVKGTLSRSGQSTSFHVPVAVLKDSFNLSGSRLGTIFTGNIYAIKNH